MRTGWAIAVSLGLALAACGGGEVARGSGPDRPPSATAPTAGPAHADAPSRTAVRLYFVHGEQVEPVIRRVPDTPRIVAAGLDALLAGPTRGEAAKEFASWIPRRTRVRRLSIAAGIASIDLTRHVLEDGDGGAIAMRFAQITCTLTQFPTVDGVRFAVDGTHPHAYIGGTPAVRRPVECLDYAGMVPTAAIGVRAGIWPFTDQVALDAYARGSDDTYRDAAETARLFAVRYVGMHDVVVAGITTDASEAFVDLAPATGEGDLPIDDPPTSMSVTLRRFGSPDDGPWTVVDATAPTIEVHDVAGGQAIASPVRVDAAASASEGTLRVEVREDGMGAGDALGRGFATGGGSAELGPFSGSIPFARPTESAGAIVFLEESAADGGSPVVRAAVTRVTFAY